MAWCKERYNDAQLSAVTKNTSSMLCHSLSKYVHFPTIETTTAKDVFLCTHYTTPTELHTATIRPRQACGDVNSFPSDVMSTSHHRWWKRKKYIVISEFISLPLSSSRPLLLYLMTRSVVAVDLDLPRAQLPSENKHTFDLDHWILLHCVLLFFYSVEYFSGRYSDKKSQHLFHDNEAAFICWR